MAGSIFVSYRRDDSRHAAGRLLDRLRLTFGAHQVFMDVDNIAPGVDFVRAISDQVAGCDVMLVIIGPGWVDARDEYGRRRLDNPNDFVRVEVEVALDRGVLVIPVLVDGASIPFEDELPPSLRPLVRRQSVRLAHERFGSDADSLVKSLSGHVKPAGKSGAPRSPSATPTEGSVGLATLGLMIGFALWVGSWALVYDFVNWPLGDTDAWARLTILYMVPTAFVWLCITGVSTLRACVSQFWWLASAASCAATLFCVSMVGLSFARLYHLVPPGSDTMAALYSMAVVIPVYVLTLEQYLWKSNKR
jgi:hypothetical protein